MPEAVVAVGGASHMVTSYGVVVAAASPLSIRHPTGPRCAEDAILAEPPLRM